MAPSYGNQRFEPKVKQISAKLDATRECFEKKNYVMSNKGHLNQEMQPCGLQSGGLARKADHEAGRSAAPARSSHAAKVAHVRSHHQLQKIEVLIV